MLKRLSASQRLGYVIQILITAGLYFVLARVSLVLAFHNSNASPVWPPSGFAFALLLLAGRRMAPSILIGAFAVNLVVFITKGHVNILNASWMSVAIAIGNTAEAIAGLYLLKRFIPGDDLQEVFKKPYYFAYFILTGLLMCLVSSAVGALTILSGGIILPALFSEAWFTWWVGDFSGVLLLTPLLLIWTIFKGRSRQGRLKMSYFLEAAVIFLVNGVFAGIVFLELVPRPFIFSRAFILIPFLLLAVLRLELRELAVVVTVSSLISIFGTVSGHGPFVAPTMNESLLTVQLFVSVIIISNLTLWSFIYQLYRSEQLLSEANSNLERRVRERTQALRASEAQFSKAFYTSPAGMAIIDMTSGKILDVNNAYLNIVGYARDEIQGHSPVDMNIHGDPGNYLSREEQTAGHGVVKSREVEFRKKTGEKGAAIFSAVTMQVDGLASIVCTLIDVTEIKRAEKKFKGLVESSPDAAVIVNDKGKIVLVNSQTEKLFGYNRNELIGNLVETLIPGRFQDGHPGFRQDYLTAPKARGMGEGRDLYGLRKDGSEFPVEISLSPLETEEGTWISSSIRDISERKKIEEKIKNINYQLTEAQRLARIGNWEWDMQTGTLVWSDEMFRIFDVKRGNFEVTMENFLNRVHPEDRKILQQQISDGRKTASSFHNFYRIELPGGDVRTLERRGEYISNASGELIRMQGTTQDVTERKKIEDTLKQKSDELISLNYSLMHSNRELERMNTELSTFAYVASHDLQEPLRKIQTFASRLLDTEMHTLSESGKDYVERMHRSVRRLHNLLDDLLTYSRLNTGEKVFEKMDLNTILEEEKDELKEMIHEKKAQISYERMPLVHAIPFQMRQLFHNLLINSLKFSADGRTPSIHITHRIADANDLSKNGNAMFHYKKYIHISFSDNGIGFESHFNERIFEVFQRLHGRYDYPGTGIGLAICKKVVENHEGMITAEGEPDKGATFHIFIPAME